MIATESPKPGFAPQITVLPPMPEPSAADEVNHRVANSLQLLAAMVSIEARGIVDPLALAALDMTQRRIGAIAGVHRLLYQVRDARSVDMAAYLGELAGDLEQSCADAAGGRHVRIDAEALHLPADDATAIGIIVSELVGNACKYAYDPGQSGDIQILLRAMPFGGYQLEVSDRGRGMAGGVAPQGTGLGSRLIAMMADRLRARYAWRDMRPGTCFTLLVDRC